MTANSRCTHETLGYSLKFKQVERRRLEAHSIVWVEYGHVFRNATLAEAAAMRKEQPKPLELLPFAEIPGIKVTGIPNIQLERKLAFEATQFCIAHI